MTQRLWFAFSLTCTLTGIYISLGMSVMHSPPNALNPLDVAGRAIAGQAPLLALIFTRSCLWYSLIALGCGAIALAFFRPEWRDRAIFSIVLTPIAWQISNVLKDVFVRPRPEYWSLIHETTYSYSSGHAMFATIVYGLWSYFVAQSALPKQYASRCRSRSRFGAAA